MKNVLPALFAFTLALSSAELVGQVADATAKAALPQVRVQVQIGNQQRRMGSSYRKESTIQPKIVVEGMAATKPLPALEATMLVITMDTRAKYKEKREVYKVESAETLPIPAVTTGARRNFEFAPTVVSFDAWRDQTNVGGAAYKYYVFGLRDPETKAILDFQTNNPALASLAKAKPDRREEFLVMSKGEAFPTTVK